MGVALRMSPTVATRQRRIHPKIVIRLYVRNNTGNRHHLSSKVPLCHFIKQWPLGELNPDASRHQILSLACLPISPSGLDSRNQERILIRNSRKCDSTFKNTWDWCGCVCPIDSDPMCFHAVTVRLFRLRSLFLSCLFCHA